MNPYTLEPLERFEHPTAQLRSKSWDEFAGLNGPKMDFVMTVYDQAAGDVWPGKPATAHWSFPGPAKFEGPEAEKRHFVAEVYGQINRTLMVFVNLPLESLDENELKQRLAGVGEAISQRN